ncbi:hypothetical protein GDO78_009528 [Eleutherodactylus coqui]|uniref:NTR domain-containing protein n=1 Tax=Eleutherodactylus coqui TaxID=57060 RepID=A0A8J6K8E8_ELECQ|nr:hypothetical protein GDO78_009528 [Eleutherodactylus coqui]
MNPFTHTLLCCALLFLTLKELTEACSCASSHPQQQFCSADVVMRARVMGEKTVSSPDSIDSIKQIEIKVMKFFKVYDKMKDIQYVYTPSESSVCGVTLVNKKEYLLGGAIYDGKVRIYLCGLNILWEELTDFQKDSISQPHIGYQSGCECKVSVSPLGYH